MFAYNEADNIEASIQSVFDNKGQGLNRYCLIANGCTDKTVETAKQIKAKLHFDELEVIEISLGDKCNAWNTYIHKIADNPNVHFFCDADVQFSANCFDIMSRHLATTTDETVAIAGMPLSGRNVEFYRSLVLERACFFGNLYGMKNSFLERIREKPFRLPIGLNWIDSFLTKAVNTDLNFFDYNLPNRTTWVEGAGYHFEGLSVFKKADIKLYINRIARYELGKIQEVFLDQLPSEKWPLNMRVINEEIDADFDALTTNLGVVKTYLVRKRLNRLLNK
jgi:glycosyltransferase involved in cell wall biosynthesis